MDAKREEELARFAAELAAADGASDSGSDDGDDAGGGGGGASADPAKAARNKKKKDKKKAKKKGASLLHQAPTFHTHVNVEPPPLGSAESSSSCPRRPAPNAAVPPPARPRDGR